MKKTYTKFKQGVFKPTNMEKFINTNGLPYYRSSLELKFMRWLDMNVNVVSWGSECVIIPYIDPLSLHLKKVRRYFVDNTVIIKDNAGIPRKYLIEIKPASQTVPPKSKRVTKSTALQQMTYAKNMAKWKAAEEWCAKKGNIKFMIITEKDLSFL